VLVRVHAASVNRLDRAVYEAKGLGKAATFPLIQGIDAAGVIEAGSGSTPTGSRVVVKPTIACRRCRSCRSGRSSDCENARTFGIHRQGGFAEYLAVPRTNVAMLPSSLSFAEGAAAAHTHSVALHMIRRAGDIGPQTTMLVTGAGGALGTAAIQIGASLGAHVVAAASSMAKRDTAASIGASAVVDSTGDHMVERVHEHTEGGVDVTIETTGHTAMITRGFESLARGGSLVLVAGTPDATLSLDAGDMYRSRRSVLGTAGSNDRDFSDVYRLMDEHAIHPVIAATYPLSETQAAMDAILDRDRNGKIVIDVEGAS
jgi:NADPH2:quinone reductase